MERTNEELQEKLETESQKTKEMEQEKFIMEETSKTNAISVTNSRKKLYASLALISIFVAVAFVSYSYYQNQVLIDTTSHLLTNYNSNYVIQNLRGDTVNTWVAWKISDGRTLHVVVINSANLAQDKIDAIKNAILSTKTVTLADSLVGKGSSSTSSVYYVGWEGALKAAYAQPTTFYVPEKFDISGNPNNPGDIVIVLTNDVSPDGLSGVTKSVADGNEILKSKITIYQAGRLDAKQLEAVTRHEFGHAMGLAHSTATEDLMHAVIETDYPYISACDVDAIKGLYNGDERSKVVCQK